MKCNIKTPATEVKAEKKYPGAAVDNADKDKTSDELVKDYTHILNDNPNSDKLFE